MGIVLTRLELLPFVLLFNSCLGDGCVGWCVCVCKTRLSLEKLDMNNCAEETRKSVKYAFNSNKKYRQLN